LVLSSSSV